MNKTMRQHGLTDDGSPLPVPRAELVDRIKKLRDRYTSQVRFADADVGPYFRDFIQELDEVLEP